MDQGSSSKDLDKSSVGREDSHNNEEASSAADSALRPQPDLDILSGNGRHDADQQHIEKWLSSNYVRHTEDTSGDHNLPDDYNLDEWPNMASLLGPELNIPLDNAAADSHAFDGQNGGPLFDHALHSGGMCSTRLSRVGNLQYSCATDDENADHSAPPLRFSTPAMPMESVMASLSTALASPRPSGASSTQSHDSVQYHHNADASGYSNGRNRLPSLNQASYNRGRRAVTLDDRRKPQSSLASTSRRRGPVRDFSGSRLSQASQGETCRCLVNAVYLLEELAARSTYTKSASMDILFSLLRDGLARCKGTMACRYCHGEGEEGVMVALACQYMTTMYDRVIQDCIKLLEDMINERQPDLHNESGPRQDAAWWPAAESDDDGSVPSSGDRCGEATDGMWFSNYRIESSCERMHVLTTLVTVQITEFAQLLAAMRMRASGRTRQVRILIECERATSTSRRVLRTTIDRAIATKEQDVDM